MKLIDATVSYIKSAEWANLSPRSQRIYNAGFTSLAGLMEMPIKRIQRSDILDFRDSLHSQPGKCRVALMTLNNVYRHLLDRGVVNFNPALKINGLPPPKPIARWEETEIDKFIDTAPEHLKAAMLLALYTGQRLSDLVRMRWDEYDGETIRVKQKKTGRELLLPVHPKLKASLDRRQIEAQDAPNWRPFILWGLYGKPYTAASLGTSITRHARRLGLSKSIHGVRKTCACILAEAGCSPSEIMSITGHKSLKEVQRYTLESNQYRLGQSALRKWELYGTVQNTAPSGQDKSPSV